MSEKEPMLCTCGKIAFVCEVASNPRPDNPTPCRAHYLEIIDLRKRIVMEGVIYHENREY